MDGSSTWRAWLAETPAELVAVAIAPAGHEVVCAFGAQVMRFGIHTSPTDLALLKRYVLSVYPWAMTYQGSCLWLACGDGGLWKLPRRAKPAPTGLVEFAVAVASSGSLIACTTSAKVVLIDASSEVATVLARRRLQGDVAGCAFQNDRLLVLTGSNLAILDLRSQQLQLLALVPLPFPPRAAPALEVIYLGLQH